MRHAKTMRMFMQVNLYIVRHSPRQRIDPVPRLFDPTDSHLVQCLVVYFHDYDWRNIGVYRQGWGELPKTCGNLLSAGNLSLSNVKKMTSTSKRIACEFLLKYQHLANSIRLFAEHSSHSRMLFASPQEYDYIERLHRFCMQCSHSVRVPM